MLTRTKSQQRRNRRHDGEATFSSDDAPAKVKPIGQLCAWGGGIMKTRSCGVMLHVDTKNSICVFVKYYLRANKRSTRNFYLCTNKNFTNLQIGSVSFCNVYLWIHLKKSLFEQNKYTKDGFSSLRIFFSFAETEKGHLCICVFVFGLKKSQPYSG